MPEAQERRLLFVRGLVQGVGFRPHVHSLATGLGLVGFVENEPDGVRIEVEGEVAVIEDFVGALVTRMPPQAQIDHLHHERLPPRGYERFAIERSRHTEPAGPLQLPPDAATCDECLREILDPGDRRHRYALTSCATCGPRMTILEAAPYDREHTTMAAFRMCAPCRREYEDPQDRRFHAQANACGSCGPRLRLLDARGGPIAADDVVGEAAAALREGAIVAVKGLGGFHLACDATGGATVAELRRRKRRDEKPFAIMVESADAAAEVAHVSAAERDLLVSPERPIVLLRRRPSAGIAASVAPGVPWLGVMLPSTGVHLLLLRDAARPLVMTSGNVSGEPIACDDADASSRLRGIADRFVVHDRRIHVRCDDSVARVAAGAPFVLRRARGYTPRVLPLPLPCTRPMLAVGGHMKSAFALGRGDSAVLGAHIGDLDDARTYREYVKAAARCERLLAVRPELLIHDAHPDYATTRYARERGAAEGLPLLAVQHHHAHMAAVLTEHGLSGPAIGVTFDGTGYGTDGTLWGGEFLVGDLRRVRRAAHLRPVALPGGEAAVRQPWRMAVSHLVDAGLGERARRLLAGRVAEGDLRVVRRMIETGAQSPPCSSVGRLFDAVAALAGLRDRVSYEGQAAIELEGLAEVTAVEPDGYSFAIDDSGDTLVADQRPLIRSVAEDVEAGASAAHIAQRFHGALMAMTVAACSRLRESSGLRLVVLSGGCFQNALLAAGTADALARAGFDVRRPREIPPGDGGLAFGQLAVAAAQGSRA